MFLIVLSEGGTYMQDFFFSISFRSSLYYIPFFHDFITHLSLLTEDKAVLCSDIFSVLKGQRDPHSG